MRVRFARHLYLPAPTSVPSSTSHHVQEALRAVGYAAGPSGEGIDWKPFRPAGPLSAYSSALDLELPTFQIEWNPDPVAVTDHMLPKGRRISRCPSCGKLIPTDGSIIDHPVSGEKMVIPIDACISCGEPVTALWLPSDTSVVFESSFYVTLYAETFASPLPTLREAVPEFQKTIERVVNHAMQEVFIAW